MITNAPKLRQSQYCRPNDATAVACATRFSGEVAQPNLRRFDRQIAHFH